MNSFSQKSFDRNHEFSSATTLLGGRPEASFNETLRSIRIMESSPLCKKNTSETRLQRKRGSLPHTPWFFLGSLCLGTSCLYCVTVLLLGHSEDGRGQWEREGSSVLQKNYSRRKGSFLVYDPTFYHLFFRILDPDVFSGLRRFFRNPAENFAGLRSGTFSAQRRIQV